MTIRYLSVCSGIEAATQAWHPLGWQPVAFSEIEPFPCAVLAHHYPTVPNRGDMTKFEEWPDDAIDLLVGGTPCQDFSIAGLGAGLDGERGNLMLTYGAIARRYRPRWLAWENVPGVLSNDGGRAFASLLGLLSGHRVEVPAGGWKSAGAVEGIKSAYGLAWRVVDAQFARTRRFPFAVPQRRRRVFVVGYLGDWRRAAAVLFDRDCLSGNPAPRREPGQRPARGFECGPQGGGWADVAPTLDTRCKDGPIRNQLGAGVFTSHEPAATLQTTCGDYSRADGFNMVAHALRGEGFDASEDGTGRGTPIVPVAGTICRDSFTGGAGGRPEGAAAGHFLPVAHAIQAGALRVNPASGPDGIGVQEGHAYTLEARAEVQAVAFDMRGREGGAMPEGPHDTANIRAADGGSSRSYVAQSIVSKGNETLYPYGVNQGYEHASTSEANPGAILSGVREALGEEAFAEWGLGILDTLQSAEVLRSALHGRELRPAAFSRSWVVNCALSRPQDCGAGAVQSLREAGRAGRSPLGWEPSEQRAIKLGAYLSGLPQPGPQAERFMLDLWQASEGLGLLREALSAVQAARRSAGGQDQSAHDPWAVRRLTPEECEFLQAMPRGYTRIPWRGKPADLCPDGPRYKALGNSMAVNVMEWLGERIAIVDAIEVAA